MRLTLLHNPEAGRGHPSAEELRAAFWAAGYDVTYESTKADDVARVLERPTELVLAAGGDGTVAEVARSLVGRDVPLAILPLGTANNIARSLGVLGSVRDVIAGLQRDRLADLARKRLDVGTARGPWGAARFLESVGVGVFTALLRDAEVTLDAWPEQHGAGGGGTEEIAAARRLMRRVLHGARARRWHVEADGEDLSGDYLMVEVMNTRFVGPRVALAPAGSTGGGRLHLALVRERDRRALDAALARDPDDADGAPPPASSRAVQRVRVGWHDRLGHLDDEPWPGDRGGGDDAEDGEGALVEIGIDDPPLAVLVPGDL
jgi:diacylglycerol kinase family enzyme